MSEMNKIRIYKNTWGRWVMKCPGRHAGTTSGWSSDYVIDARTWTGAMIAADLHIDDHMAAGRPFTVADNEQAWAESRIGEYS